MDSLGFYRASIDQVKFGEFVGSLYLQALGYCPDAACSAKELGPVSKSDRFF